MDAQLASLVQRAWRFDADHADSGQPRNGAELADQDFTRDAAEVGCEKQRVGRLIETAAEGGQPEGAVWTGHSGET